MTVKEFNIKLDEILKPELSDEENIRLKEEELKEKIKSEEKKK